MLPQKEFYFIRHGQTDHNLHQMKVDHAADTPLNETGRSQARAIELVVAKLPVKAICCSPMKRAVETKEIITPRLFLPHYEVADLGECTAQIWHEMRALREKLVAEGSEVATGFLNRVRMGMETALLYEAPVLIVAHGGVHWALCALLNIQGHEWATENCLPLHFVHKDDRWVVTKIFNI